MKLAALALSFGLGLSASAQAMEVFAPANLSRVAQQLVQIGLQDDPRIAYRGLDGVIGPQTIEAIKAWQALEGIVDQDPLDKRTICTLINRGIQGHGSSAKRPSDCQ